MKAALVSLGSTSSKWTADAMKKYFDQVDMIHLKEVDAKLGADAGIYYQGKPFPQYDCVYLKGSFRYANLLHAVSTFLKGTCYTPINSRAFSTVHNKLLTHLELQQHNIPMPRTYILAGIDEAKQLLKEVHYPIIMKFPEGTQGKGVMIADSQASASSMLDALGALKQPFIIQEYVESGDMDIRAFVVGDTVVAGMMRIAQAGEGRANIHAGGEAKPYTLDRKERKTAVDTARALGARICGVDMLRGPTGPLVIEANISPGLQGITNATNVDVAGKIAKFLHDETAKFTGKHRKIAAQDLLKEKLDDKRKNNEIITNLTFKGERIVLPSMITKMTGFSEKEDYTIKAEKGRLVIEEFSVKRH
jgi:ribosomal protein S6--L-glutamate ligase